jgi:hypothetical protein
MQNPDPSTAAPLDEMIEPTGIRIRRSNAKAGGTT